jgi:hypothetical protein
LAVFEYAIVHSNVKKFSREFKYVKNVKFQKIAIAVFNDCNVFIDGECPRHSGHGFGGICPLARASAGPEKFDGPLGFGG